MYKKITLIMLSLLLHETKSSDQKITITKIQNENSTTYIKTTSEETTAASLIINPHGSINFFGITLNQHPSNEFDTPKMFLSEEEAEKTFTCFENEFKEQ